MAGKRGSDISFSIDAVETDDHLLPDDHDDNDSGPKVPHYALPNVAAVLPEYTNSEQDYIRRAFQNGNYTYLATVPDKLRYNGVTEQRAEKMETTRRSLYEDTKPPFSPPKVPTRRGMFQTFEYIPSPYSLADELMAEEKRKLEEQAAQSGHAWHFLCADSKKRPKYEEVFIGPDAVKYPHVPDPYERSQQKDLEDKLLEKDKILHGPFIPNGKRDLDKSWSHPTRKLLKEILEEIRKVIALDWGECRFFVETVQPMYSSAESSIMHSTSDIAPKESRKSVETMGSQGGVLSSGAAATRAELIIVRFDIRTVTSEMGLLAYMNTLARHNTVIGKYGLNKVADEWNCKPDEESTYVYFAFRPPWAVARPTESFYCLHPEERQFSTSQLFKGTSTQSSLQKAR